MILKVLAGVFLVSLTSFAAKIAVIDSGVDYKHKDLASLMWTNSNSSTTDASGNVYSDDTHGWNFAENNNQIIDYKYLGTFSSDCYKIFEVQAKVLKGTATIDEKAWYDAKKKDPAFLKELAKFGNFVHGTHVSGISSKSASQSEIIGIKLIPTESPIGRMVPPREFVRAADNPFAKLFLMFMAQQQAQIFETVGQYVKATNSELANGSFGTSVKAVAPIVKGLLQTFLGHEPSDQETQEYSVFFVQEILKASQALVSSAPETLFVFAAGNDGTNNDELPVSPANIKQDNTLSVAATLGYTALASFTNFGASKVEVAAPGVDVRSTIPGDEYLGMSGTSMAAPFVTNVAARVKDNNTRLTPAEIKRVVMETVDIKSFLQGKVKSSGIVNAERAERAARYSKTMDLSSAIAKARVEVANVSDTHRWDTAAARDIIVVPLPML